MIIFTPRFIFIHIAVACCVSCQFLYVWMYGYFSLDVVTTHRDGSNEKSQHMFSLKIRLDPSETHVR